MEQQENWKNLLWAVLAITALTLAYYLYMDFYGWQQWQTTTTQTDTPTTTTAHAPLPQPREHPPDTLTPTTPTHTPHDTTLYLTNNYTTLSLSLPTAQFTTWRLNNYTDWQGHPLALILQTTQTNLLFQLGQWFWNSTQAHFQIIAASDTHLILRDSSQWGTVEYYMHADTQIPYIWHWQIRVTPSTNTSNQPPIAELHWQHGFRPLEKHPDLERQYVTIYYRLREDEEVASLSPRENDEEKIGVSLSWIAFKQQFFTLALFAQNGFPHAQLRIYEPEHTDSLLKIGEATLGLRWQQTNHSYICHLRIFGGPNHFQTLRSVGQDLEEVLPLGWAIFRWITRWLILPFFHFLEQYIANYGIIILLLTIFIKLLLTPLTWRSYVAMAKMSALRPLLEELREKYKDQPQKLALEQMALMRRAGVNPLGGCLPMLLQLPILIAMYRFFPASIELRGQQFLWIDDLSTYDAFIQLPFHIPLYGSHVSLLALLLGISMILFSRFAQPDTTSQQYAWLKYVMPLILIVLFNSFPAALNLYYLYFNILGIGQSLLIRKWIRTDEIIKQVQQKARQKQQARSFFEAKYQKWLEIQKETRQRRKQQRRRP